MEVAAVGTLKQFSAEKMQKINLFETENFFCDIYCLEPGQGQKAHAHQEEDAGEEVAAPRPQRCGALLPHRAVCCWGNCT